MKKVLVLSLLAISLQAQASASKEAIYVKCGGNFEQFKQSFKQVAQQKGFSNHAINEVLNSASYDTNIIKSSQRKGVFKQNFSDFYNKRADQGFLNLAKSKLQKHRATFEKAKQQYGVSPEVLVVFWGLETSFGGFQGDFNTVSSLATLSYDCNRPELFQPQLLAAIQLTELGMMNPRTTTGAWAGEIGQFQFLPQNIIDFGVDGDGDRQVDLKNSAEDAILSAAKMLQNEGWKKNSPWIEEVLISTDNFEIWQHATLNKKLSRAEWNALGVRDQNGQGLFSNPNLTASLVAPEGRLGSIFLVYENFDVFLEWNQSLIYTLSAANMANALVPGVTPLKAKSSRDGLSNEQLVRLQLYLQSAGYDVGEADGILGAGTRTAVSEMQGIFGLPQDGWPTLGFYQSLGL